MVQVDTKIMFQMYQAGADCASIAASVGMTSDGVAKRLRRAGFRLRPPGNSNGLYAEERDRQISALYSKGVKAKEIARQLGVSSATIAAVKKRLGLEHRVKPLSLTDRQQANAIRMYQAGMNFEEISKKYGVAPPTIGEVLKRHGIKARRGWSKYRTIKWTDRTGRDLIFKSTWELKFAQKLDSELVDWKYEPVTFRWGTSKSYTPDFVVYKEGAVHMVYEIHGWLDDPTKERILGFVNAHPRIPFELLGPAEMAHLGLVEGKYRTHHQGVAVSAFCSQLVQKTITA